jgi:Ni,Fe-hydrogenase III small subunit
MSDQPRDKLALEIELMTLQIDKTKYDIDRVRQEMKWEPYKAVAVIVAGVAAMAGIILGVAHIIH